MFDLFECVRLLLNSLSHQIDQGSGGTTFDCHMTLEAQLCLRTLFIMFLYSLTGGPRGAPDWHCPKEIGGFELIQARIREKTYFVLIFWPYERSGH